MITQHIATTLAGINWPAVTHSLNEKGYALVNKVLLPKNCKELIDGYTDNSLYRKTIQMEQYHFGIGEYKYFNYSLPPLLQTIRETVYAKLAPIANSWMDILKADQQFPDTLDALKSICISHNQTKPTVLILKYRKGGYNTLHQDLYGAVFFPFQLVLFLNDPGKDYTGGEFVLLQQSPRKQAKAIVVQPAKGDMLIFTNNFRPVNGSKGYYRAVMKHGVSEVHSGSRHTLGIIFHDAL